MNCIFCKIISGELPSARVWEDDKHLAIFDIFPNTKGMTLLLTKQHFDSDVFKMPVEDIKNLSVAEKILSEFLKRGLGVERVAMVMEGTGVNHAHIKMYPMHKGEREMEETKEIAFFNEYPGYISTQIGPKADFEELKKLAEEIKNKN
ncbi:MAG: hypothetical protein A2391_00015 [Candidatus Brennerbacteria bacterium RIFOXYB1_FULL_41_13]|nr:MAG: hypothetical protein A2391_00015 [Candidatus Brennerbacteria bacterium RIFOXYB1_FULL_41_13]